MAKAKKTETAEDQSVVSKPTTETTRVEAQADLAAALAAAIRMTQPVAKKTVATRVKNTPWTPKDGSPRAKMKRKFYQHGIPIGPRLFNEEIELLNQIKPGYYCDGVVKVTLRKDRGIDVDYPVKTASQRLRLVNQFGITNFASLLRRIIDEKKNPKNYRRSDDLELFGDDETE